MTRRAALVPVYTWSAGVLRGCAARQCGLLEARAGLLPEAVRAVIPASDCVPCPCRDHNRRAVGWVLKDAPSVPPCLLLGRPA